MIVEEEVVTQDIGDHLRGVCHWSNDPSANACCGAPPAAWANCNYEDYEGDYCKCGKPLCQLCEIAWATGGGGSS